MSASAIKTYRHKQELELVSIIAFSLYYRKKRESLFVSLLCVFFLRFLHINNEPTGREHIRARKENRISDEINLTVVRVARARARHTINGDLLIHFHISQNHKFLRKQFCHYMTNSSAKKEKKNWQSIYTKGIK